MKVDHPVRHRLNEESTGAGKMVEADRGVRLIVYRVACRHDTWTPHPSCSLALHAQPTAILRC